MDIAIVLHDDGCDDAKEFKTVEEFMKSVRLDLDAGISIVKIYEVETRTKDEKAWDDQQIP